MAEKYTKAQAARFVKMKAEYPDRPEDDRNSDFTQKEKNRLEFEKWRLEKTPEDHSTEGVNPFPPQRGLINVEPGNVTSMQNFIERHRRGKK